MDILLIRHGQAVDEAPGLGDAGRWLTAKGRKATRRVSRWLAHHPKRAPIEIWTSPLVRAVQSAEILAAEVGIKAEVRPCSLLTPGHDPGDIVKLLATSGVEGPLALVGHEPQLTLLAGALLGEATSATLKKSGILALSWAPPAPRGELWFVLDPARMKPRKHREDRAEKIPEPPSSSRKPSKAKAAKPAKPAA